MESSENFFDTDTFRRFAHFNFNTTDFIITAIAIILLVFLLKYQSKIHPLLLLFLGFICLICFSSLLLFTISMIQMAIKYLIPLAIISGGVYLAWNYYKKNNNKKD